MKLVIFFLVVSAGSFISCNRKDKNVTNDINYFKQIFSHFPSEGWNIDHYKEYEDVYRVQLSIFNSDYIDTSYHITYEFDKLQGKYNIMTNFLIYKESDEFYFMEYREEPLFIYKSKDQGFATKEFLIGKYYYDYYTNKLSAGQNRFFEFYKDSLIKIEGNNLPDLPNFSN